MKELQVMIVAQPGFYVFETASIPPQHIVPKIFQEPHMIPMILHAFAPLVIILRARMFLCLAEGGPDSAKSLLESRLECRKAVRPNRPGLHTLAGRLERLLHPAQNSRKVGLFFGMSFSHHQTPPNRIDLVSSEFLRVFLFQRVKDFDNGACIPEFR